MTDAEELRVRSARFFEEIDKAQAKLCPGEQCVNRKLVYQPSMKQWWCQHCHATWAAHKIK